MALSNQIFYEKLNCAANGSISINNKRAGWYSFGFLNHKIRTILFKKLMDVSPN